MEMAQSQKPFGFAHILSSDQAGPESLNASTQQFASLIPNNFGFNFYHSIASEPQYLQSSVQSVGLHATNQEIQRTISHSKTNDLPAQNNHTVQHSDPEKNIQSTSQVAKPRAVLSEDQAIAIFQLKVARNAKNRAPSATSVAKQYGVSEKTIRDIWNARTWTLETAAMDPARPFKPPAATGRPKGRRDRIPRKRRAARPCAQLASAGDSTLEETTHSPSSSDSDAQPTPIDLPQRGGAVLEHLAPPAAPPTAAGPMASGLGQAGSAGRPPDHIDPYADDWVDWPGGSEDWPCRPAHGGWSGARPPADAARPGPTPPPPPLTALPNRRQRPAETPPHRGAPPAFDAPAAPWACAVAGAGPPAHARRAADAALPGRGAPAPDTTSPATASWCYGAAGPQPAQPSGLHFAGPGLASQTAWDWPAAAHWSSSLAHAAPGAAAPAPAAANAAGGAWGQAQWPAGDGAGAPWPGGSASREPAAAIWPAWGGHAAQAEPPQSAAAGPDPLSLASWAGPGWSGSGLGRQQPAGGAWGQAQAGWSARLAAATHDDGDGGGGGGFGGGTHTAWFGGGPGPPQWAVGGWGPQAEGVGCATATGPLGRGGNWAASAVGLGVGAWAGAGAGVGAGGWAGAGAGASSEGWAGSGVGAVGWAGVSAAGAALQADARGGAAPLVSGDACRPFPEMAGPGGGGAWDWRGDAPGWR